jgi:hypothetical protein
MTLPYGRRTNPGKMRLSETARVAGNAEELSPLWWEEKPSRFGKPSLPQLLD